jgi:hypothetical protein
MTEGFDPMALCPLNPNQPLRIEGSAGNDRLSIFSNDVPDAKPIQIHGNAGNDRGCLHQHRRACTDRRPGQ